MTSHVESVEISDSGFLFPRPEHTRMPTKEKILDRNTNNNMSFRPTQRLNCDVQRGYGGGRTCYQDPTMPPFIAAGTVFRSGGKDVVFS